MSLKCYYLQTDSDIEFYGVGRVLYDATLVAFH